jgi:transcriptional regulator with XRE-family HTH domain
MLPGRQLYLLRVRDKNLSDEQLAELLNISVNDIITYEYGIKSIPEELYAKWEALVKSKVFLQ